MEALINPLALFLLVWGGAAALYLGGVLQGIFPFPSTVTIALVLLNVVTFTLGYLTWTLFRGLAPEMTDATIAPPRPLTSEVLTRALRFTLAAGVAALALEMCRVVMITYYFETTWLDLVTQPELFRIRMVRFIQDTLFQTSGVVMLLSVTSSLFSIGFVLLGVLLYLDRTGRKYLYLLVFFAVALIIAMIHLSRYEMTANILYLVLAYFFMVWLDRSGTARGASSAPSGLRTASLRLLVPLGVLALLFGLIDLLLHKSSEYDSSGRLQGWLFHFYWYIAAPTASFNEFVSTFHGNHQWGQCTFFPLYKWLCRLHLAREAEVAYYGEKVFIPYLSNTYTYLRNFYEDFGVLGVAIIPYLLGWAAAAVQIRARRHFQFLNLYLVLLLLILFSFYNYYISSNQIYLQVLFGFLLFRYEMPQAQRMSTFRWYQDSST